MTTTISTPVRNRVLALDEAHDPLTLVAAERRAPNTRNGWRKSTLPSVLRGLLRFAFAAPRLRGTDVASPWPGLDSVNDGQSPRPWPHPPAP